jgi:hypothetical protein
MKRILLLTFICLSLSVTAQRTPQDRAENSVQEYLQNAYKNQKYKGYNFGELYKTTPNEIIEIENIKNTVDSLRKLNQLTSFKLVKYDSIIQLKTKLAKQKNKYSTYDINHYFVIEGSGNNNVLYQYNFTLYPNGKIKNIDKLLEHKFVSDEYDWFYHYYRRSIIISNMQENKNTYNYIDNLLITETQNKSACVSTVLTLIKIMYNKQYLDTTIVSTAIVKKWFLTYKDKAFISKISNLKPIKDKKNNTIGYNIFVKYKENESTKAHYFELDSDYIIRGNLVVEKPFDKYFE